MRIVSSMVLAMSLVVLSLGAALSHGVSEGARDARDAKLIAVKFHADWCGKCKSLEKPLAELRTLAAEDAVLFLTVDLTDPKNTRQAEYLLSAIGAAGLWEEYGRKTGFVLVLDAGNKKVVGTIQAGGSAAQMRETLRSLAG